MRAWPTAAAAVLLVHCAGQPAAPPPSDGRVAKEPVAAPVPWVHAQVAASWPVVDDEPRASRGHGDGHGWLTVRVSPGAEQRYESWTLGATMPSGTVIVAEHSADGRRGLAYVMEKTTTWSYAIVDAAGLVISADVSLCKRCHQDAVSDELFGPPRRESQ
ncbi:MAG: hypothetical protein KF718_00220 [Polyangiaceae bacterium]|nr:hypothetical protein [Polyangiaceae bacterium]